MDKRPTIALCIPAYNAAAFLPRLLNSAKQQTIPFDEIWVYDDASTDTTAQVAEAAGAQVIRGETNQGCSYGKNQLAKATSCDWIHFHDADDLLLPGFVERARSWMEQEEAPHVVLFGSEFRDFETNALILKTVYDAEAVRKDPLRFTVSEMITSNSGIYRRDRFLLAGGYDLDPLVLYNEDSAMHCQLARAGLRFGADPAIVVVGYRRNHSMSQGNQRLCFRAQYHVMRKAATVVGQGRANAVARRLWEIASASASWGDWDNVRDCALLAEKIDGRRPPYSRWWLWLLMQIHPVLAFKVRELAIQWVKPGLRRQGQA